VDASRRKRACLHVYPLGTPIMSSIFPCHGLSRKCLYNFFAHPLIATQNSANLVVPSFAPWLASVINRVLFDCLWPINRPNYWYSLLNEVACKDSLVKGDRSTAKRRRDRKNPLVAKHFVSHKHNYPKI